MVIDTKLELVSMNFVRGKNMNDYEKFVETTDLKVDADDDIQFYLDGMNEEHGEAQKKSITEPNHRKGE